MKSVVLAATRHIDRERVLAMTPAERLAFSVRLSAEGLASYMAVHQVDRATARKQIAATRQLGRQPSRSGEGR